MSLQLPPSAASRPALPVEVLPPSVRRRLRELTAGQQPLSAYLYDTSAAVRRARELAAVLPDWAALYYAVKANSHPAVVEALSAEVDGLEVASVAELDLALASRADAATTAPVVAAGPAKSPPFLTALVRAGIDVIHVESRLELHRVNRIAEALGLRARVAPRVNPRRIPLTGSLHMGGAPSQFGVPEPEVPALLREAARLPGVDVVGFHVHAASNNLDAAAQADYLRWCVEWSTRTARACGVRLRHIDVGGGIGVAFEDERPFDVAAFGAALATVEPPSGVRVVLEPGRYLVADCGWYAAEVIDVKRAYGTWFVLLRGGINHFQLPTSWDIVHNITVLPVEAWPEACPRPTARDVPVTVVGELCTPEDTLLRDVSVDQVRAGDVVVFPYAGSYGWEFAMHRFLGHPVAERHLL